ncbi:MAG: ABC transporter ATP-binding protein/permease [Bacteroidetes bacterium]|nr:ABC transporter ATP-binding protein/permease [Bacteroidota bacterium]
MNEKKKKLSPIKRFWMLLIPDKKEIRNVYVYGVFLGLLNLTLPVGIQAIINLIQGGEVSTSWLVLILFVCAGIAMAGFLQIKQLTITENLQQKIFTRAAFEFTYRIPRVKLERLLKEYAPELMNRFFDVVSVQKGLSKILIDFSTSGIQVLFGLLLLSIYHPFFIVFSLLLIIMVVVIFYLTARRGLQTSVEESKNKYLIVHWLEELARANTTFKLAGRTELPLERVNKQTDKYIVSREEHFEVLKKQYAMMVGFKVLVALGLLLIGGLLVIEQQMNIGQFVAAEIIIILLVNSVEKLILSLDNIYDVLTALEKIGEVTDLELEQEGGIEVKDVETGFEVELNSVDYIYPSEKVKTIDQINMKVKSGERFLISGGSDSGKSTLLFLMSGLFRPTNGYVTIDDIPITNYDYESLHANIGGYMRDESLFEATLLENITIGREKATFDNVKWAIKNLGLEPLIKNLSYGYDTKIIPHGRQFSKSTSAKLLLARAIVDRPRMLLLENNFSYFSPDDRKKLLEFLLDKSHPWTVIMTSSQASDFPHLWDREVRLEKGKVVSIN